MPPAAVHSKSSFSVFSGSVLLSGVGLSTQPCGEPMLSVMVEERWDPNLTINGCFVRKS